MSESKTYLVKYQIGENVGTPKEKITDREFEMSTDSSDMELPAAVKISPLEMQADMIMHEDMDRYFDGTGVKSAKCRVVSITELSDKSVSVAT